MTETLGYAILEVCRKSGCRYWVRIGGPNSITMIAADKGPSQLYADRGTAEHDAEILRERNVRDVGRSRWRLSCRTEPATYTVIELTPWSDAVGIAQLDAQ